MQIPFKPEQFSNLYKPAIIMISIYVLVNVAGFFVQHIPTTKEVTTTYVVFTFDLVDASARNHVNFEEKLTATPAPPEVKVISPQKQSSSGGTINPHLP